MQNFLKLFLFSGFFFSLFANSLNLSYFLDTNLATYLGDMPLPEYDPSQWNIYAVGKNANVKNLPHGLQWTFDVKLIPKLLRYMDKEEIMKVYDRPCPCVAKNRTGCSNGISPADVLNARATTIWEQ